jgi:uncharacterized membrane protein YqjE
MLKIPLNYNKETIIGAALFGGAVMLFVINLVVGTMVLIRIYGAKPEQKITVSIDGTALSEAVQVIDVENSN